MSLGISNKTKEQIRDMKMLKFKRVDAICFAILTLLATGNYAQDSKTNAVNISSSNEIVISLEKRSLPSTGPLFGMSNIFFAKIDGKKITLPKNWRDVEIAAVIDDFFVSAVRYKDDLGEVKYVVDTDGDIEYAREKPLTFNTFGDMRIADVIIHVNFQRPYRPVIRDVAYQIILSKDGYTYARIAEYRQGTLNVGPNSYNVMVRPFSRNSPGFDLSGGSICLLDSNQNGEFNERWELDSNGNVIASETISITDPFMIGSKKLKLSELDVAGTRLKVGFTNEETSISKGFKAPNFILKSLDDSSIELQSLKGKIVLLEFWSVLCFFCERILPDVNALIKKNAGKEFVAIAVARESNAAEVTKHLAKNQREAKVALNSGDVWQTYNRQIITPTYYLIDKKGVIRLSGYGAYPNIIKVIDKKIEEIRSDK